MWSCIQKYISIAWRLCKICAKYVAQKLWTHYLGVKTTRYNFLKMLNVHFQEKMRLWICCFCLTPWKGSYSELNDIFWIETFFLKQMLSSQKFEWLKSKIHLEIISRFWQIFVKNWYSLRLCLIFKLVYRKWVSSSVVLLFST